MLVWRTLRLARVCLALACCRGWFRLTRFDGQMDRSCRLIDVPLHYLIKLDVFVALLWSFLIHARQNVAQW